MMQQTLNGIHGTEIHSNNKGESALQHIPLLYYWSLYPILSKEYDKKDIVLISTLMFKTYWPYILKKERCRTKTLLPIDTKS